ncbi:MAG: hypothetical protein FWE06_02810 [Oscillospiraceae bacterium]|nr:hypothetical protein [Oscillospiraceae bacterium]
MKHENMALLTTMDNTNLEVDSLCALLNSCDIDTYAMPADNNGITQILLGQSMQNRFGFDVYVSADKLQEAKDILAAPPVFEDDEE